MAHIFGISSVEALAFPLEVVKVSKKFQTGAGNKVKLYIALLPLDSRTEPVNVTVTTSGAVSANATSIPVTALSGPIAGGTPLIFGTGGAAVKVYLTADAPTGATSLNVEAVTGPIASSTVSTYTARQRLNGGTSTGATIGADRTETTVFEDPLGYSDGVVTGQNWEVPWTANLLADDDGYRRVFYAASNGISGREVYVWQEDPPPSGATVGDGLKGPAVVTNFSKDFPADGMYCNAA